MGGPPRVSLEVEPEGDFALPMAVAALPLPPGVGAEEEGLLGEAAME